MGMRPRSRRRWAALAVAAHDRPDDARKAAAALVSMQQANGEVVIRAGEQSLGWTTSLAIVALEQNCA